MEWIKTDDKLPHNDQYCWVYPVRGMAVGWFSFERLGFWNDSEFRDINEITHWKPFKTQKVPNDI